VVKVFAGLPKRGKPVGKGAALTFFHGVYTFFLHNIDSIRSFRFYIVNQNSDIFEYHYFVSGLFKSEIDPFSNITIL